MKKNSLVKSFFAVLFVLLLLVSCGGKGSFKLTLPEGVGVVSPENLALEAVAEGTEVTVKVTIPENKKVGSFTVNEEAQSLDTDNQYTFTMSTDTTVAVSFVDITYSLSLPEDNSVSVVSPADLDLSAVVKETEITLEVTVPEGKILGVFSVNAVEQSLDASNQYTFTISEDTTVVVTFVNTYSLTLPDSVSVVSPSGLGLGAIPEATEITLEVIIPENKAVDVFKVNKEFHSFNSDRQYTFTMLENAEVKVTFVNGYSLTLPDEGVVVTSPENVILSAIPEETVVIYRVVIDDKKGYLPINTLLLDGSSQSFKYEYEAEEGRVTGIFVQKKITMNASHNINVHYLEDEEIPAFEYYKLLDGSVILTGNKSKHSGLLIPHFVAEVCERAFISSEYKRIKICSGVSSVEASAFANTGIQSIFIPSSVVGMGARVFSECQNLTDIYCEASEKPEGWHPEWDGNCPATVTWNYPNPNP